MTETLTLLVPALLLLVVIMYYLGALVAAKYFYDLMKPEQPFWKWIREV